MNDESRPRQEGGPDQSDTDGLKDAADGGVGSKLSDFPQWIVWRFEDRDDGKPTKVLCSPTSGRRASTTDPSTWTSYNEGTQALAASPDRWDGVGFVFTKGDPYTGLDFDKCIKDGRIHPFVQSLIQRLNSYTEISVSSTGIHVIIKGKLNGDRNSTNKTPWGGKFEVYDRARFFTMTGRWVESTPKHPQPCQKQLDEVVAELLPPKVPLQVTVAAPGHSRLDDNELLGKARQASNGAKFKKLFDDGNTSDYDEDDSVADLALVNLLVFWAGGDRDQMDRLFRRSALMRSKWDRLDYRERTIAKAMEGKTDFYGNGPTEQVLHSAHHHEPGKSDPDGPGPEAEVPDNTEPEGAGDIEPERIVPPSTNPMGVARQFVADKWTNGPDVLLRCWRGDFFGYNGTYYPEAEGHGVRGGVYSYLEHAVFEKRDAQGNVTLEPWHPTRHKVDDVLDALKAIAYVEGAMEPPAWLSGGAFPADEIVAMENGLLHVPTRTLLPHSPAFFSQHALPFGFAADAPYPSRWLQFLKELWSDDESAISTLQEMFGYIIGGGTEQQKIFLLVGPKRGGKGTIGRVLTGILGRHNVAAPTLASVATNFGLSPLITRPLALVSDARLGKRTDGSIVVERLLSISGEDSLTVDRKYKEPWTGRLPTRFMVLTNELPELWDSSGALASRFVMLVLTRSWIGQENPTLTAELLEEAPGILNWSLEGLDRLNERGYFVMPDSSVGALQQLEDLSSPVSAFLRERCVLEIGASVPVDALWQNWKMWCDDANRSLGTKSIFGRNLRAAAPTIHKSRLRAGSERQWVYEGVRLRHSVDHDPDDPVSDALRGHGDLHDQSSLVTSSG